MSMVKISLSWPEKLKSRKILSACVLSLMYDGDLMIRFDDRGHNPV